MSEFSLDSLLSSLSDKPAETQIEKAASEQKASVADQLKETLTKEASASNIGESNMSVETGNAIADSILAMLDGGMNKAAAAGDPTQGNNVKVELDEMERQHADRILQTPRQGRTVTEVAKALQARAPAGSGADCVVEDHAASREGNGEAAVSAIPSDIEKSAAINELMEEGFGLDEAYAMVKQASDELEDEAFELEKVAAVEALMDEGIDFDDAISLVKAASEEILYGEEEYSDLEKVAAAAELMDEDGLCFEDAFELVKQAAAGAWIASKAGAAKKSATEFATRVKGSRASDAVKKSQGITESYVKGEASHGDFVRGLNKARGHSAQTSRARKQLAGGVAGVATLGGAGYAAGRSRNN